MEMVDRLTTGDRDNLACKDNRADTDALEVSRWPFAFAPEIWRGGGVRQALSPPPYEKRPAATKQWVF